MIRNYNEVPWYWYFGLLVLAFFAGMSLRTGVVYMTYAGSEGLIVVLKGQTTLPWWSYIIALILGGMFIHKYWAHIVLMSEIRAAFVTPFSTLLYARMGNGIATNQLMKMVAGAVNPGKPVANLYVCCFASGLHHHAHTYMLIHHPFYSSPCGATTWSPLPSR